MNEALIAILLFVVILVALIIFKSSSPKGRKKLRDPSSSSKKIDAVDPINEADVYLAYGRKEQAIEVLEEAIEKYPNRGDIVLRLSQIKNS